VIHVLGLDRTGMALGTAARSGLVDYCIGLDFHPHFPAQLDLRVTPTVYRPLLANTPGTHILADSSVVNGGPPSSHTDHLIVG
jgi:hypothetical protein